MINLLLLSALMLMICPYLLASVHPDNFYISAVISLELSEPPKHVTERQYLSVALDTSLIANGFRNFRMKDAKLLNMISHLSPAYLRIGGTMADFLIFDETQSHKLDVDICSTTNCGLEKWENFTMTGSEWTDLYDLTNATGLQPMFDLNCLLRTPEGDWDSSNAEKLISYSNENNMSIDWQLGNEPNSFKHNFNVFISPQQLAKDFHKLRQILKTYEMYKASLLIGPDTTRPIPHHNARIGYFKEFVESAKNTINAVSFHQYYINSKTAELNDFLNYKLMNVLAYQINVAKKVMKDVNATNKPIWLSETSSSYGGGAPNLSDTYAASFLWLDKLGLSAKMGLSVVVRQTLFGGHYALIGNDYEPNPDWWTSMIYKYFVGPEVLHCGIASPKEIRLYCHCTAKKSLFNSLPGVTVFGMNLQKTLASVRIQGTQNFGKYNDVGKQVFAYQITGDPELTTRNIYMNGNLLQLNPDGSLPGFRPRIYNIKQTLRMPPFSMVFWVIHGVGQQACPI